MMLRDFNLAIRHLWRRRLYTIIIVLSLTIGFSSANLLISYLIAELNTDSFHSNKDRTFQVFSTDPFGGKGNIAFIMDDAGDYMINNYPEVKRVCRVSNFENVTLKTGKGEFQDIQLLSTDSSFFSIFDFPLSAGNRTKIFTPESILLTREKARIIFGESEAIGRTLTLKVEDTVRVLTVSGLIDRAPENSHLTFEALVEHNAIRNKWKGGVAYIMLNAATQCKSLEDKINNDVSRPGLLGPASNKYFLEPLVTSHFNSANKMAFMKIRDPIFVRIGYLVCGLILFMASFNFANLFLLSLQERSKETGIKKTLGVTRWNLLKGSLVEITVYISVAFGLSLFVSASLLPQFNTMMEGSLAFSYLSRLKVMASISSIVLVIGVIVGFFSGIKQMRMRPVNLIRNNSTSKVSFNKFLFTAQFVISIVMTICMITIVLQMIFIENEPLGFNRNMIQIKAPDKSLRTLLPALKQQLLKIPGVGHVAVSSGNPISANMILRYDLPDKSFYTPYLFNGDEDLIKTLDLTLVEGELFSAENNGCLVNEQLVRQFNMRNPIGEAIPGTNDKIIGVVKDFTCGSFKENIPPVIISYKAISNCLLIDYQGELTSDLIKKIKGAWTKLFPDRLFEFQVLQEDLLKKYKDDIFFYKLMIAFSAISLIISCFGLFAVSWVVIQNRIKEIGIRKVVGAKGIDILRLLSVTFLKRITIAFLIAAPLAYYSMGIWLEHFVKKIKLSPAIFIISALVILIVSFATLSSQLIRAVLTNPIDELRSE